MRLFAAIEIPHDLRALLSTMAGGVPGARWVDPQSYHVTLRFMGELDRLQAEELDVALADLAAPGFALSLSGVGQFDSGGRPRLLWAGVEASASLSHLARKIVRASVAAGLPPEDRQYFPHVTLAGLRNSPMPSVMAFIADHALFRSPPFTVDRFTLFESRPGNEQPVYLPLAQYALERKS